MDATCESNLYQAYEKRQHDATRQRPILPVTIITGSLGAGKTTLMRKILRSKVRLANHFASVRQPISGEGASTDVRRPATRRVSRQPLANVRQPIRW